MIAAYAIGGAERHVMNLASGLNTDLFEVLVLAPEGRFADCLRKMGTQVRPLQMRSKWELWAVVELFRKLRQCSADVVHTHDSRGNLFGRIAGRCSRAKVIVSTVHASPMARRGVFGSLYLLADRITAKLSDVVVAVSDSIKNEVTATSRTAAAPRVVTIPPGVDLKRFDNTQRRPDNQGIRLGMVGRLERIKGADIVFRAMPKVLKHLPDVKLYVIGEGSMLEELKEMARMGNFSESVNFMGYRDNVAQCLKAVDILVCGSRSEGFGLAAAEAMAMGIPVVGSDVGGMREVVENDVTGYLVPVEDTEALAEAIVEIAQDVEKARSMGEAGRQRVWKNFGMDDVINRIEHLYLDCLKRRALS